VIAANDQLHKQLLEMMAGALRETRPAPAK
jgi:hypothetical protein